MILDNRGGGSTMEVSPPIPVRIEWADSQGSVTASWLAAHFIFSWEISVLLVCHAKRWRLVI